MVFPTTCPRCNQLVKLPSRYCDYCGIDLTLVAGVAERGLNQFEDWTPAFPVSPEILVPRMGEYLVEKKLLKPEQLMHALEYQQKRAEKGSPILLGQALRELGYISPEILDQVVTVQILQLQLVLDEKNKHLEASVQERTKELKDALGRLTELNKFRTNFIANISHELRTPLTLLKGYVSILADGGFGLLTSGMKEALERIVKAQDRLEKLIDDLIQFAVAQRGELNLEVTTVPLEELLRNIVKRYSEEAEASQISLKDSFKPGSHAVRCDREKISWVIGELVGNAIKFTPTAGKICVEAINEGAQVTIAVTDNGIGIPAARQKEIFEPFHQLDGSSTRRYGGTGLGLALSQKIVEAHGSTIRVRSITGKGSRFEFALPVVTGTEIQE